MQVIAAQHAGLLVRLLGALFHARRQIWLALAENALPILFSTTSIAITTLCYAWWAQVSNRNRFILTLYLPMMFCTCLVLRFACSHIQAEARVTFGRCSFKVTAYALFLAGFSLFTLGDLNDPLNRRNMIKPGDVSGQLVQ